MGLRETWTSWVRPSPQLLDPRDLDRARNLSSLLIIYILLNSSSFVVLLLSPGNPHLSLARLVCGGCAALFSAAYVISRTRRYLVGSYLLVGGSLIGCLIPAFLVDGMFPILIALSYLNVSLLLACLVLPLRDQWIVFALGLVGSAAALASQRALNSVESPILWIFLLTGGALTLAISYFRTAAEQSAAERSRQMVSSARLLALGELSAGIAHEIRNPLTALSLQNMALRESLEGGGRERNERLLNVLQKQETMVQRIADIISVMLSASREGGGKRELPKRLNPVQLLRDALLLCEQRLKRGNIRLVQLLEPGLSVTAQPVATTQILLNLLSNALDALERVPNPKLQVQVGRSENATIVAIEDNGPGISAEDQKQIFEAFFTTKADGHGVGLGLSISRKLANQMGAELAFESTPGKTRFALRFPDRP